MREILWIIWLVSIVIWFMMEATGILGDSYNLKLCSTVFAGIALITAIINLLIS